MKRPVAFRVKDHADGWLLCHDEEVANHEAEEMGGALVQGLYVRDGSPWPSDWQPIETRPRDDSQFLACTEDGRVMIFNGIILDRILTNDDRAPKHLQFPATHWMPLPTPPERNAHS